MLESAADEIERKRLICDARLLAMLQQRNTVSTYELGRDDSGNIDFTMLPEQLRQDLPNDHRTNIFRLGAVLNVILCGEKLAHGEKLHEMVDSMLNQEPADAAAMVKHQVLTLLNAIAARCLGKNPDSRFQSMEEVIMFLTQSLAS